MISLVIVSHSARLAEGVCELAGQVAQGKLRLAAAGGTTDPEHPLGTDAFKVLEAIESVYSEDGVLVLMDLGSAVLSAETALEFLDEDRRRRVMLCAAPLVEGAVAAASQAVAGGSVTEILREAQGALAGKAVQLGAGPEEPAVEAGMAEPTEERFVALPNRLGLHARPAAQLIHLASRFQARVTLENVTSPAGPFDAGSINGILSLGARQGHRLAMRAQGPEARQALAALAAFIEGGCGDNEQVAQASRPAQAPESAPGALTQGELTGIAASPGIAIGPLVRLRPAAPPVVARVVDDPESEWHRLEAAIRGAREDTLALYEWAKAQVGPDQAGIFDAQSLFLEDPALIGSASHRVHVERANAEFAWQQAAGELAGQMQALEDPYLRARAADVTDVAARVLRRLTGNGNATFRLSQPCILAAHDLTPSDVQGLKPGLALGVCLETGSTSAHSVILVRAMGIPAVVGLGPGISALADETVLGVDGDRGKVWVSPGPDQVRTLESGREAWLASRRAAQSDRHKPGATRDGRRILVLANLNRDAGVLEVLDSGAEGVGVLRTEFLFLGRAAAPDEEEQFAVYRTIAEALGQRPLVIRTLDVGGDKELPYVEIGEEANPFLGWRGIRLTLGRRDLLETQLRAILRAACGHPVEVLFPMVSTLAELREGKAVLASVEADLEREGVPFQKGLNVGVMIEVPSAVAVADQLAREVSGFSIGTNDLIQYVMAADRTNARVASLADPFQPAVLRVLRQTINAGRQAGIHVTLCGELAADTLATPLLLGLGLEEFSVSAPLVPELKRAIARWSVAEAEAIALQALALDSSEAVRGFLSDAVKSVH